MPTPVHRGARGGSIAACAAAFGGDAGGEARLRRGDPFIRSGAGQGGRRGDSRRTPWQDCPAQRIWRTIARAGLIAGGSEFDLPARLHHQTRHRKRFDASGGPQPCFVNRSSVSLPAGICGCTARESARKRSAEPHLGLPDMLPENIELRRAHTPLGKFVTQTFMTPAEPANIRNVG